jgi:hypothetical protein
MHRDLLRGLLQLWNYLILTEEIVAIQQPKGLLALHFGQMQFLLSYQIPGKNNKNDTLGDF